MPPRRPHPHAGRTAIMLAVLAAVFLLFAGNPKPAR